MTFKRSVILSYAMDLWQNDPVSNAQGLVKVVLSRIKNPFKSLFTKGDF